MNNSLNLPTNYNKNQTYNFSKIKHANKIKYKTLKPRRKNPIRTFNLDNSQKEQAIQLMLANQRNSVITEQIKEIKAYMSDNPGAIMFLKQKRLSNSLERKHKKTLFLLKREAMQRQKKNQKNNFSMQIFMDTRIRKFLQKGKQK